MNSEKAMLFLIITACINAVILFGAPAYFSDPNAGLPQLGQVDPCLNNNDPSSVCGNSLQLDTNSTVTTSNNTNIVSQTTAFFSDLVKWTFGLLGRVANVLFTWWILIDAINIGAIGFMLKSVLTLIQIVFMFIIFTRFVRGSSI